jgi:uncharacterized protein YwgA
MQLLSFDRSRLRRLALVALALQTAGRVEGRTKLQKIIYLVNLIGWNAVDFKYHNYGPYSDTLATEVENMRNNGWVQEAQNGTGDRTRYDYSFSKSSQKIGYSLVGKAVDMDPKLEKLAHKTKGLVIALNGFNSDQLEIMATLMFLKMQDATLTDEGAIKLTSELKPQFSKEQVSEGRRIFNIMRPYLKH